MNMPDTSGRYVIVFVQETQPSRVRENAGGLVMAAVQAAIDTDNPESADFADNVVYLLDTLA